MPAHLKVSIQVIFTHSFLLSSMIFLLQCNNWKLQFLWDIYKVGYSFLYLFIMYLLLALIRVDGLQYTRAFKKKSPVFRGQKVSLCSLFKRKASILHNLKTS